MIMEMVEKKDKIEINSEETTKDIKTSQTSQTEAINSRNADNKTIICSDKSPNQQLIYK